MPPKRQQPDEGAKENNTEVSITTAKGRFFTFDMKEMVEAFENAHSKSKPPLTVERRHHREFFDKASTKSTTQYFSRIHAGPWLASLDGMIEERFELVRVDRYDRHGRGGVQPKYRDFTVGHDQKQSVLISGERYVVDKETRRKYLVAQTVDDDGDPRITIHVDPEEGEPRDFTNMLSEWFHEFGPLKGAVFTVDWKFLNRDSGARDRLVLESELEGQIERHVFGWIERMSSYEERGLPTSRGILLAGPPGTGKTLFCLSLMERAHDMTCIVVTADRINSRGVIADAFRLARNLAPSIVVLEDLDTLGGLDRRSGDHPLLGELLNALDGVESNNGVLCLGTTNHITAIDEALRDRPGRFDKVLVVDIPSQVARVDLLSKFGESFRLSDDINMEAVASLTDGYTGAWLLAALKDAELFSHQRGREIIEPKDVRDSIDEIDAGRIDARKDTHLSDPADEFREGYA